MDEVIAKKAPPPEAQHLSLLEQIKRFPPPTWEKVFAECEQEIQETEEDIERINGDNVSSYPSKIYTFSAFWVTPLPNVKVVIIGQDPYHQEGVAMGLSFSTFRHNKVPGSLINIFKEIKSCYPETFTIPTHGDLTPWAAQGVLLLNVCLTVKPGAPGSHGKVWMGTTNQVVKKLTAHDANIIWVLWGNKAQALARIIGEKGTKFVSAHPSGLSANRGFFGNRHPILINERLKELGRSEIDWNLN